MCSIHFQVRQRLVFPDERPKIVDRFKINYELIDEIEK